MKIHIKAWMIWLALLAGVVSGCGGGGAAQPQEHGPPTDDEVLVLYERAAQAYEWFFTHTMPIEWPPIVYDGYFYHRVTFGGIRNMADLHIHLESIFTDEMVGHILAQGAGRYRDINGELFARPVAEVWAGVFSEEQAGRIVRVSENEITFRVIVYYPEDFDVQTLAGTEHSRHDFILTLTGEGWRFADFPLPDFPTYFDPDDIWGG